MQLMCTADPIHFGWIEKILPFGYQEAQKSNAAGVARICQTLWRW
jgi:hypothetical protein